MNIKKIKEKLKNNIPKPIDEEISFSILVPIIEINNELNLIYEVRSKNIRQPGEISFPGGKIEANELPMEAAIRETWEEIGILKENIDIITELDYASSKSGSFVYSFLGHIKNENYYKLDFNKDEVSELFFVPLSFFMKNEPEKYYINYHPEADDDFPHHMINNGENYNWENIKYPVYFYKYNDYIIWGLTAKITYSFINKIKNTEIIS